MHDPEESPQTIFVKNVTGRIAYVWSAVYVDALVLRDRDLQGDGFYDERLYVQQDGNYNPTLLSDNTGVVVERFLFDPYGVATFLDPDWATDAGGSDYAWTHLHQGGRQDPLTGLVHFRLRDYAAHLGRWTQQDPAGYVDGANRYEAYRSDPSQRDPTGLAVGDWPGWPNHDPAYFVGRDQSAGIRPDGWVSGMGHLPSPYLEQHHDAIARQTGQQVRLDALEEHVRRLRLTKEYPIAKAMEILRNHADASQWWITSFGIAMVGGGGKGVGVNNSMLGAKGTQLTSKTTWKGNRGRLDVENPAPGRRPGQIHYQDGKGAQYLYDPHAKQFLNAPPAVNRLLDDPSFQKGIEKGLQCLGEK